MLGGSIARWETGLWESSCTRVLICGGVYYGAMCGMGLASVIVVGGSFDGLFVPGGKEFGPDVGGLAV